METSRIGCAAEPRGPPMTLESGTGDGLRAQDPCTLTIFGATGDLTHRKLMPGLFALYRRGLLPAAFAIVGFARRDYADESFRAWMEESLRRFASEPGTDAERAAFLARIFYHRADLESDPDAFRAYAARLRDEPAFPPNHLFYLSVKPDQFEQVIRGLHASGLVRPASDAQWTRVVIEKPFGRDPVSARHLNEVCRDHLDETQVFRMDHYLGKETVQNMLSFRFANAIFEPVFNHRFVDHVQITAAESVGMEQGRGAFYDEAGALRDMVQNHLLQLLCLVAMEPPARMTADSIRNEKVKLLQSIEPLSAGCVSSAVVRAQYDRGGGEAGAEWPGYTEEDRVPRDSHTETFVALRLGVRNWRWAGVPFYLRTGKRLARRVTEVMIQFKVPPLQLFQTVECEGEVCDLVRARPNRLIFRIQPREGISLRFSAKRPSMQLNVEDVDMNFSYADRWPAKLPEAYERLLLDAARGDSTLFTRADEVEAAWQVVAPIQRAWALDRDAALYRYPAGSWGPREADAIFANYDTEWHNTRPS
jgi:glucose-6-phosphate 1-dehydrogenase